MKQHHYNFVRRAERRAAAEPAARVPLVNRSTYPSDEGLP